MNEPEQKIYTMHEAQTRWREVTGKDVSVPTIIMWVEKWKLGFQPSGPGGKWAIYADKWDKFCKGEFNGKNNANTNK